MTTLKTVKAAFEGSGRVDTIGRKKDGSFIARCEFFYTHGYTAEMFEEHVTEALKAAGLQPVVIESYEAWKPFRGGASTANSSHWGCVFRVLEPADMTLPDHGDWAIPTKEA